MVLKSKKSKSRRSTLRHKYKVIKKVKQHHQKKAKEEKKNLKAGRKPKAPKDPGIPAQWPFKEELLKDLEWQKQRILAQEKAKREEKKLKRVAEREATVEDEEMQEPVSADTLQQAAVQRQAAFAAKKVRLEKPLAANDKDGSRRAFFKEFVKVVSAADVIIEVLDARDPLGSRCLDVERFVRRSGADKKIILLLNKIDLVPREVAEAWLKYLREELPTVAFKCSTQKQATNLKQGRMAKSRKGRNPTDKASVSGAFTGSDSLGAETLLQLLKNYTRNADIKTAITVGIVGLPNVGKSSLINSLKRARVAQVGNAPGITRSMQQINLDKHINLLDSPGIVFSAGSGDDAWAALRNCVKVEQLSDPQAAVAEILKQCPAKQLMVLYKVPAFKDAAEFLQHVAFRRGRLLPGGIGDSHSAARVVLHDWHNGKLGYYTQAPKRGDGSHEDAAVVDAWGEAFDAHKVFANERNAVVAGLPSLEDSSALYFPTETAGPAVVDMASMEAQDSGEKGERDTDSDSDGDSDREDDATDAEEAVPHPKQPGSVAGAAEQAGKLYSEAGQFNPLRARAEKKLRKRQKRVSLGDDFDFAEAFAHEVHLDDADASDGDMSEGDDIPNA